MVTENNNSKKHILIGILIFLIFVFLFQEAYAKYVKTAEVTAEADIAKWAIKVNNETIANKTVLTNSITPTLDGDAYTKSGVLAPGTGGFFEIDIDATESDVNFDYDITLGLADSNTIADLEITGYAIGTGATVSYSGGTITGSVVHNTANNKVKVFFQWNDATGTMNNAADTAATVDGIANANILVTLHFIQTRS